MRHETLLQRGATALVLMDFQEKILPAMAGAPEILARARILAAGAIRLGLPVIATDQYPQGLGATVGGLKEVLPENQVVLAKKAFSAAQADGFLPALTAARAPQVVLAGIETHICVLQTALDLQIRGYQVHLALDACGSRATANHANAAARLQAAGVIITNVESVLFELLEIAEGEEFKAISKLVR